MHECSLEGIEDFVEFCRIYLGIHINHNADISFYSESKMYVLYMYMHWDLGVDAIENLHTATLLSF